MNWIFATNSNFVIRTSLQPSGVIRILKFNIFQTVLRSALSNTDAGSVFDATLSSTGFRMKYIQKKTIITEITRKQRNRKTALYLIVLDFATKQIALIEITFLQNVLYLQCDTSKCALFTERYVKMCSIYSATRQNLLYLQRDTSICAPFTERYMCSIYRKIRQNVLYLQRETSKCALFTERYVKMCFIYRETCQNVLYLLWDTSKCALFTEWRVEMCSI